MANGEAMPMNTQHDIGKPAAKLPQAAVFPATTAQLLALIAIMIGVFALSVLALFHYPV